MKKILLIMLTCTLCISLVGCKKKTECDLCLTEDKCTYYDDAYYCDECYETIKYYEELDEEYNN